MNLKIAAIAGIATVLLSGSTRAAGQGNWTELELQAMEAQQSLTEAAHRLRVAAPDLYEVFVDAYDINMRHMAERAIQSLHPEEYGDFITARGVYDTLMEAINVATMNSIAPVQ